MPCSQHTKKGNRSKVRYIHKIVCQHCPVCLVWFSLNAAGAAAGTSDSRPTGQEASASGAEEGLGFKVSEGSTDAGQDGGPPPQLAATNSGVLAASPCLDCTCP